MVDALPPLLPAHGANYSQCLVACRHTRRAAGWGVSTTPQKYSACIANAGQIWTVAGVNRLHAPAHFNNFVPTAAFHVQVWGEHPRCDACVGCPSVPIDPSCPACQSSWRWARDSYSPRSLASATLITRSAAPPARASCSREGTSLASRPPIDGIAAGTFRGCVHGVRQCAACVR